MSIMCPLKNSLHLKNVLKKRKKKEEKKKH